MTDDVNLDNKLRAAISSLTDFDETTDFSGANPELLKEFFQAVHAAAEADETRPSGEWSQEKILLFAAQMRNF